jgi:hypothetical protein
MGTGKSHIALALGLIVCAASCRDSPASCRSAGQGNEQRSTTVTSNIP